MSSAVSVRFVEAIVGLGHALVAGDHERGAVVVIGAASVFEMRDEVSKLGGKGNVSKQSDGVYRRSSFIDEEKNRAQIS